MSPNFGRRLKCRFVLAALLLSLFGLVSANAAEQGPNAPVSFQGAQADLTEIQSAPVEVDGRTLFYVRGVLAYPAERRAQEISKRIQAVAADRSFSAQEFRLEETPIGTQILAGTQPIMTVLELDARLAGVERPVLAHVYVNRIRLAIDSYRHDREPRALIQDTLHALLATLILLLGLWAGRRFHRRLRSTIERRYKAKIQGLHFQSLYFFRTEQLWRTLLGILSFLWFVVVLAAIYIYVHYVLLLFPWTRGISLKLLKFLTDPLRVLGSELVQVIPDLVFLAIVGLVTWYLLKLVSLFFASIEKGAVTFSGFDPEWARPTYRLIRLIVIALALVVAYPYIPGSSSAAFKGVSLFIGVIFSLGSTSLIGNVLAGYSLVYRHTFKLGDWVKIGAHAGIVEQTGLMVTTLRTPKNEIVVVPNSMILNGEVINYTMLAKREGLILHSTVGIGYETPWRQVEAMLLEAAERTPGLLREPKPFVLHKELGDFAVTYEINMYCDHPPAMFQLYTALHQNILDVFNEYGVQIMTPAYVSDPLQAKVVPIDQWYAAPASPRGSGEPSAFSSEPSGGTEKAPPVKGAA